MTKHRYLLRLRICDNVPRSYERGSFPRDGLRRLLLFAVLLAACGGAVAPRASGQSWNCSNGVCQSNGNIAVAADSGAEIPSQMTVQGQSNQNRQLLIGYNTTSDYGSIQAVNQGTALEPLILNAAGGNVGIGTLSPLSELHVQGGGLFSGPTPALGSTPLAGVSGVTIGTGSGFPFAGFRYSSDAADQKNWDWYAGNGQMHFRLVSDAGSVASDWLQVNRSGASLTSIIMGVSGGNVGIGISPASGTKLAVNGLVKATEVMVTNAPGADYVFAPDYRLAPLSEVADYVKANRHLPDIPSASEVAEKGVSLGDMQAKLLAKIEELTLHMIAAEEANKELRERLEWLEARETRGK